MDSMPNEYYEGVWWYPDNEKKHFPGTLVVSNSKAILTLNGSERDFRPLMKYGNIKRIFSFDDGPQPPVILDILIGKTSNGEYITLYKIIGFSASTCGRIFTIKLEIDTVIFNAHFKSADNIMFRELTVYYKYLESWSGISGFNIDIKDSNNVLIEYTKPFSIQLAVFNNCIISLYFLFHKPYIKNKNELSMTESIRIRIQSIEEMHINNFEKIIYLIRNFLTLLFGIVTYPVEIRGKSEEVYYFNDRYGKYSKLVYPIITIRSDQNTNIPDETPTFTSCYNMLTTYNDISDDINYFINNWFNNYDRLEVVYDLYFGTLYGTNMYNNHKFLSLIQSLESYHRGKYQKNSNEIHLFERLNFIYDRYYVILAKIIPDKQGFLIKVRDTRNYLTHYDDKKKLLAARGDELDSIIMNLKMVLEICLLEDTGFQIDEIKKLMDKKELMNI